MKLLSKSKIELVDQILRIEEAVEILRQQNDRIQEENNHIREENNRIQKENTSIKKENEKLQEIIEKLRKEIARIKKVPCKPEFKSNTKDLVQEKARKRSRGKKRSKQLIPTEKITLTIPESELPEGAILKDYQQYTVQEMETRVRVICYRVARYSLPCGKIIKAKKPIDETLGHFGPELIQHVVYQYHHNNVPQCKILKELCDKSIDISAGQINTILAKTAVALKSEYEEIFESAKKESDIICVDDTGERHKKENWFCTAIQNKFFAYYKSTKSKSRISFLKTMGGKHNDFVLNDEAFAYMRFCKIRKEIIDILLQFQNKILSSEPEFDQFIEGTLLTCYRGVKSLRNIKEACLIGALIYHGLDPNLILLSDGAGQFNLFRHALCWVHIGRCFKKYIPEDKEDEADLTRVCDDFWAYYEMLDKYSEDPSIECPQRLRAKFDKIFRQSVKSEKLSSLLFSIWEKRDELLRVLENPNTPLHNNGTESVIRPRVVKRKISGPTRSEIGRESRDIFASLDRTCRKNGISFWNFLGSRIKKDKTIPFLSEIIRQNMRARSPAA